MIEIDDHQAAITGHIPEKFTIITHKAKGKYAFKIKNTKLTEAELNTCSVYDSKYHKDNKTPEWEVKSAIKIEEDFINVSSTDFEIISNNNFNGFVVKYKDKYPISLTNDVVSDLIMNGAIGNNNKIIKPMVFAVIGKTKGYFILENGYIHKQIIKSNELKKIKPLKLNELVPGTIYLTQSGRKELFIGAFETTNYSFKKDTYDHRSYENNKKLLLDGNYNQTKEKCFVSIKIRENSYYDPELIIKDVLELKNDYNLDLRKNNMYKEAVGKFNIPKGFIKNLREKHIKNLSAIFSNLNGNASNYYNQNYALNDFMKKSSYFNLYEFTEEERTPITFQDMIMWQ